MFFHTVCNTGFYIPSRGANLHATDNEGKTPLQYAINMQNITDEEVLHMLGDVD